jgi:hypothetical protein
MDAIEVCYDNKVQICIEVDHSSGHLKSKEDGLEKNKWLIIGASVIVLFIVSLF